jgi:hypothetical protein
VALRNLCGRRKSEQPLGDGAITKQRQDAIYAITDAAGSRRSQIAFVTGYQVWESAGFRKTVAQLAWGSFAWFVSEPGRILIMRDGGASAMRLAVRSG